MSADFVIADHGSIILLLPQTEEAKAWCEVHLPEDRPLFGAATAIERRYFADIYQGIIDDALTITLGD